MAAYQASGDISNRGVAQALTGRLQAAQAAIDIGMIDVASNDLRVFLRIVEAQTNRSISPSAAADLMASVQWILGNM